jgi:hypothetical protein
MGGSHIIVLALVNCYGLSHDQQAYCQARQHDDVSYCYTIEDPTLRQTCRSEIKQMPWDCDSIRSPESRQICRERSEGQK